ncbi:1-acyl-sn-glycerol-3-phosphate acyltransferase [Polaribacter sp. BAL334]|uniref:1-acyl-sn-glycerol-3-phosphate acyltransferase n=1 Tax=Polaribacter sp. BAL334 TaxID=1708178 RepID=UPI0018D2610F|nr:1-acyl-sn-glycerol-3-phosphate acyltransferase [Polaribacter sp. BAL334]MBG7611755.1 1-acyl-sn-glycerol-3-phosphate acyltransferase [Polaribacter sp. BAL334]
MIQKIWYQSVKLFLKISLHFYAQKIIIKGSKNIPKKGAVLFAVNHPNALMDPLFVTTFNPRENHFLVRADVFKKPLIRKFLSSLNLMPIFRIRDGIKQLSNNDEVFEKCFEILKKQQTLIIFPQGGHSRMRTIQPLSKGFTRIVFGALERFPELEISVIPVGITYQNSSVYPSKVCVQFGEVIDAKAIYESTIPAKAIVLLKEKVSTQLQKLTVHIPNDEHYTTILTKLNNANVDFTNVDLVNNMIAENTIPEAKRKPFDYLKPLYYLILLNSIFPYLIWKRTTKIIKEIEFVDTLKFSINVLSCLFFYSFQALIIGILLNFKTGLFYFLMSIFMIFFYTKTAPTNTEN